MKSEIFKPKSLKIFLIGLSLTFLMAAIPRLEVKSTPLIKPAITVINPLLEAKQNNFQLSKPIIIQTNGEFEQASAYIVVNLDSGEVIISKNMDKKLPIASLTKIMTSVVALDLAKPEEEFIISENAASQIPTKVMLKPGENYKLKNLLRFMLISSANDSAESVKEGIDKKYGEDTFIKAMNLKAKLIGLKNTHFTNAEGYDNKNHYSSAGDLTVLSAYALNKYPEILEIVSKEYEDLTGGQDFRFYLNNWNGLLGVYPGVFGVKTGNTGQADHTTIVASKRAGRNLLTVVLGAPGVLERDLWAAQLLDAGFEKLAGLPPVQITENQLRAKYSSWKYFK